MFIHNKLKEKIFTNLILYLPYVFLFQSLKLTRKIKLKIENFSGKNGTGDWKHERTEYEVITFTSAFGTLFMNPICYNALNIKKKVEFSILVLFLIWRVLSLKI